VGWQISVVHGRGPSGWQILELGNVYPMYPEAGVRATRHKIWVVHAKPRSGFSRPKRDPEVILDSTRSQKNDSNDARSVAIVALHQPGLRAVTAEDHVAVLRMLANRHTQLSSLKTQAASRLHAVLASLVPGGLSSEMTPNKATALLRRVRPTSMIETERKRIAHQLLGDIRRLNKERTAFKARLAVAVEASGTTLTQIYGVGPVVAGLPIGHTGDISRFATRHHHAAHNGTAPIEASSGARKRHRLNHNRMLNHTIHTIAVCQLRYPHTEGRAFYERKLEEGKTKKEAIRALKRRLSNVVYRHLQADQHHQQR
jgi:transposase